MLRLLLVDDEIDVANYFTKIITTSFEHQLEVTTCYSAKEALQTLEEIRIDIIVSDIKMPHMNGLEMVQQVRTRWPKCQIIFLSGFQEFDTIYESIQQGHVRYLTKLESKEVIVQTVQEVITEIQERIGKEKEIIQLEEQVKEAHPLLRNRCVEQVLFGVVGSQDIVQSRLNTLDIPIDLSHPLWIVGAFVEVSGGADVTQISEKELYLKNIVYANMSKDFTVAYYRSEMGMYIWILQPLAGKELGSRDILTPLEYAQSEIKQLGGDEVSFVYTSSMLGFAEVRETYRQIKQRLGYRQGELGGSIVALSVAEPFVHGNVEISDRIAELLKVRELEGYIEFGSKTKTLELLHYYLDPLSTVDSFSCSSALEIYYRIACVVLKYVNEWNLTTDLIEVIDIDKLLRVDVHSNWRQATEYLITLVDTIMNHRFSTHQAETHNSVAKVVNYIHNNIDADLSLVRMADLVNYNPAYLSRLFKESMDINLYDYILGMRMNKAVELLLKSNDKIQDIAQAVGYDSSPSFARAFRKYTGKTPSEYREM